MVAHVCNHIHRRIGQEDHYEFKSILGYIVSLRQPELCQETPISRKKRNTEIMSENILRRGPSTGWTHPWLLLEFYVWFTLQTPFCANNSIVWALRSWTLSPRAWDVEVHPVPPRCTDDTISPQASRLLCVILSSERETPHSQVFFSQILVASRVIWKSSNSHQVQR